MHGDRRHAGSLTAAATLVRPGGLRIYATCSIDAEENVEVVEDFLTRNHEFRREPASDAVPQRHGIDGAFAARLRPS